MPNMITPSSGATCGATQANSPGLQRARAEQAMMMAPMKRVTRALNLCARRGKRALRLLGERGGTRKKTCSAYWQRARMMARAGGKKAAGSGKIAVFARVFRRGAIRPGGIEPPMSGRSA